MNNSVPAQLAEKEYYHGTCSYKALLILYEGFRLKKEHSTWGRDGTFKHALYLTKSVKIATFFGNSVFKCQIADGMSILRIDERYDQSVIDSLKREFGKNIVTGDITKAIPRNKHLKRKELIHLVNYRFAKMGNWKDDELWKWDAVVSSIRRQLRRHKYDAIGTADDIIGIGVLNPSLVTPITLYAGSNIWGKGSLKTLDEKRFAYSIQKHIKDMREMIDCPEEETEYDHLEVLLARYCREHGLSPK